MNMMKRYKTPINRTYHGVVLKIKKSDLYHYITVYTCLLYTSPSPRDRTRSRMPSSA